MGMAASQARLLTITARMHDVEYQAQSIQNAKIQLATQEDEVYQNYLAALDATTFTVKDNSGNRIVANFNTLCGLDAVRASKEKRYVLRDEHDRIIISDDMASGYESFKNIGGTAYDFALYMMEGQPSDFDAAAYQNKAKDVTNEKNEKGALGDKIESLRDQMTEKLYEITKLIIQNDGRGVEGYAKTGDSEETVRNNIKDDFINAYWSIKSDNIETFNKLDESTKSDAMKLLSDADALYEQFLMTMIFGVM